MSGPRPGDEAAGTAGSARAPLRSADPPRVIDDVCTLALARRVAALVDRAPDTLREGAPLPRGWHPAMFNVPTRQSQLRADGAADLGVSLPDLGLPRLMIASRTVDYVGHIPIGSRVRRESRSGDVREKTGRSGRFALVRVEHRVFVEGAADPVLIEDLDYVLREAGPGPGSGAPAAPPPGPEAVRPAAATPPPEPCDASRMLTPDEPLLFRYSAITDNPHRIHYDLRWATEVEGYPALVVNGNVPAMFLLEMFRSLAAREPDRFEARNLAPMYCGRPLRLAVRRHDARWRLWATDAGGTVAYEAWVS
jgi:3-methylfumaryl-CoA hydratase